MSISRVIKETNQVLPAPLAKELEISKYKSKLTRQNECHYLVSLFKSKIIYQRGLRKFGLNVPEEGECFLDPSDPYLSIHPNDLKWVLFLSSFALNSDHIYDFDGTSLEVNFRIIINEIIYGVNRICGISERDPITGCPTHYFTTAYIISNPDLGRGVTYNVEGVLGKSYKFADDLKEAYTNFQNKHHIFTPTQRKVLRIRFKSNTDAVAARRLGMPLNTVRHHLKNARSRARSIDPTVKGNWDIPPLLRDLGFELD